MEKKCKKAKWLSEEALQIAVKRRDVKSKGEKERYSHLNAEFQRIARREKKAFPCLPMNKRNLIRFSYLTFLVWCTCYSSHKLILFYGLMISLTNILAVFSSGFGRTV